MQSLSAKFISKTYLTPDVLSLCFQADNPLITFMPGQFLTFLFVVDAQEYYRPYSIATLDATQTLFTITLKILSGGIASNHLQKMQPGDVLAYFGPHGDFILNQASTSKALRLILVATGTGIVPFHAMQSVLIKQLRQHNELQVYLIHGVKTEPELIYRHAFDRNMFPQEDINSPLKDHPRFFYRFSLSQEEQCNRVQDHIKQLSPITARDDIYLCGSSHMINSTIQLLQDSQANIFIEKFS